MFKTIKHWFMQQFMKTRLIEALRLDLKAALAMVDINQQTINVQQMAMETLSTELLRVREELAATEWWRSMDEEQARMEAEERADEVDKLVRHEETMEALRVNKTPPDKYCITLPNGDCVSEDPRCMHQPTTIGSPEHPTNDDDEYIPVHLRNQAD